MYNDDNRLRSIELQKFSDNATQLFLDQDKLLAFFESVKYVVVPAGDGFKGMCPDCTCSACYIGLNGKHHKLYWKCYDRQCASNTGTSRRCHNLLGLVKGLTDDDHLGKAIQLIASFLGYEGHSWDITNGKYLDASRPDHGIEHEEEIPF